MIVGALATLTSAAQPLTVSVMVSVTNRSGTERVRGLTATDFRVFEDGVEQEVASVAEGPGPVSVAVVLDTSDGMAGRRMEMAQRSVESLVAGLAPEDEVALVTHEHGISVAVPWTDPAKFPKLEWARWKTMLSSEVLQGVYQALGLINEAKHARTAVILVSNAEQAASKYGLREFVKSRRESETGIYGLRTADLLSGSVGIGGPRPGSPHSNLTIWDSRGALISFDDLVRDSGGLVLPARTAPEAERSATKLVSELRNQYVVTFTSTRLADNMYRRLKVELRKTGPKLRHRTGYLAKPQ